MKLIQVTKKIGYKSNSHMGKVLAHQDSELASLMWERLIEHCSKNSAQDFTHHVYQFKVWESFQVSNKFRFRKYKKGNHFHLHTDAAQKSKAPTEEAISNAEPQMDYRSFLSLVVYLNEDFTGGETLFYQQKPGTTSESQDALIWKKIQGRTGTAVIFSHSIYHKAEPVKTGRKYVARTDVLYRVKSK